MSDAGKESSTSLEILIVCLVSEFDRDAAGRDFFLCFETNPKDEVCEVF